VKLVGWCYFDMIFRLQLSIHTSLSENLKGRSHLGELSVDGRVILERIINK